METEEQNASGEYRYIAGNGDNLSSGTASPMWTGLYNNTTPPDPSVQLGFDVINLPTAPAHNKHECH